MNPGEFFAGTDFHDSLLETAVYSPELRQLRMVIDFCWWRQPGFISGSEETGLIELVFSDVTVYENPAEFFRSDSILDVYSKQDSVIFCMLPDEPGEYYEISIKARAVQIHQLTDEQLFTVCSRNHR